MSSIKISPNASGTGEFVIAAPNSNTNRTLTLPDATGTINTSGAVNEVPAGSASAPSIYPTGDTNTGIFFPAADTIGFAEGGAEAMRIDSSGNVGIGVTSITAGTPLQVNSSGKNLGIAVGSSTTPIAGFNYYSGNSPNRFGIVSGIDGLLFYTGSVDIGSGTERARIDSSGNLLLATTTTTSAGWLQLVSSNSKYSIVSKTSSSTGAPAAFANSSGTIVGEISTNGSSTTYSTSSDYRLKENIQPMTNSLEKVAQLKPVTYIWKIDGSAGQGFIAHELQDIIPEAVIGQKDATYEDGNPKYQGVDTSFLVATLTAAIQELKAINDAQATRIETLEAQNAAFETRLAALEAK